MPILISSDIFEIRRGSENIDLDINKRLGLLRIVACAAFLIGIALSHELWFPVSRTFPRAPIIFTLPDSAVMAERVLSSILIVALVSLVISRRTAFVTAGGAALVVLVLLDQTRLQPWVYQYSLILAVLALVASRSIDKGPRDVVPLGLVQILIAGLYVWSGVQKINYTFVHETLPMMFAPLGGLFSSPLAAFGVAVALGEALIGLGLLWRKTRRGAVVAAFLTHVVILSLLVARDYNRVVWSWNAALIVLVIAAFWRTDNSLGSAWRGAATTGQIAAATIVSAAVLLPVLSFAGWWDAYLSGSLYSGSVEVGVVRVDPSMLGRLPNTARSVVFQTKTTGESMLPLFEWSIADLGAPVYPESRVYRSVFREMCRTLKGNYGPELIIKERPTIFDGTYRVDRSDCPQFKQK